MMSEGGRQKENPSKNTQRLSQSITMQLYQDLLIKTINKTCFFFFFLHPHEILLGSIIKR